MDINNYTACWYCDNIVDHPEQVGLLHLDFPRCFVLIPNNTDFQLSRAEDFKNEYCQINWLDPSKDTDGKTKDEVLDRLWNFMVAQEREEEDLASDREIEEHSYGDAR